MTVRTARLASGSTGTANVTTTCYTCPSGKTAIVKSIYVSNGFNGATSTIMAVSSGAAFINIFLGSIADDGRVQLDPCWIVLEPGDSFVINANQTNAIQYLLSGAELQGVAP